jgi:hypothetical protein
LLARPCTAPNVTQLYCAQVGSIEGRVAVHHVEEALQAKNFTFKCHRDGNDIYSVNSIAFHPQCAPQSPPNPLSFGPGSAVGFMHALLCEPVCPHAPFNSSLNM